MQRGWSGTERPHVKHGGNTNNAMAPPVEVQVYIHAPSATVAGRLLRMFEDRGLQVYRSFDLQAALERLPECGCPYHGQSACTCQYIVWLVYAPHELPVLVVLHGRDDKTWITLSAEKVVSSRAHEVVAQLRNELSATRDPIS